MASDRMKPRRAMAFMLRARMLFNRIGVEETGFDIWGEHFRVAVLRNGLSWSLIGFTDYDR